jgi:hypothetical protein
MRPRRPADRLHGMSAPGFPSSPTGGLLEREVREFMTPGCVVISGAVSRR